MAKFAAQMLEAKEEDIVFADGLVSVAGVPDSGIPFSEVAGFAYVPIPLPRDTEPGLSEEAFWEAGGRYLSVRLLHRPGRGRARDWRARATEVLRRRQLRQHLNRPGFNGDLVH